MNKNLLSALVFLVTAFTTPNCNADSAVLCVDNYPPFTYFIDGKAEGAMVEAMQLIAQEMNFDLRFSPETPFARCLRMLEFGLADFMVSLMPTPERLAYMAMYPYSEPEPLRLVARDDNSADLESMADITKIRIGLVNGFQYPELFSAPNLRVVLSPTPDAGIRQLRAKRIDVLVLNETVALHLLTFETARKTEHSIAIKLLPLDLPRPENTNSIGISKKSSLIDRRAEFAKAIEKLRENGVFDRLVEKHQKRKKSPD